MGAWGTDPFGNDTACDWVYDLESTSNLSFIEQTLQRVHDSGSDCLDAAIADEAIAAADTICRLCGHFYDQNDYTEQLDRWVDSHSNLMPSLALIASATKAIYRIKSEPSELLELWMESDESWLEDLERLLQRLGDSRD